MGPTVDLVYPLRARPPRSPFFLAPVLLPNITSSRTEEGLDLNPAFQSSSKRKNMAGSQRSGLYSLPSDLDVDQRNWSPRTNRHRPVFDSDDEKLEEVSSPETDVPAKDTSPPTHSAFYHSFTNLSFETRDEQQKVCRASSRCLTIGRPVRSVGLKDIDLRNNHRAEFIRQAKQANRSAVNRDAAMPWRLFSLPNFPRTEFSGTPRQASESSTVKPTSQGMETPSPETAAFQSRGRRAWSHGGAVPFIDLTVGREKQTFEVATNRDSSQGSEGEDVFDIPAGTSPQQAEYCGKSNTSGTRYRWHSAMMQVMKNEQATEKGGEFSFSDNEDDGDHTGVNTSSQFKTEAQYKQPRPTCRIVFRLLGIAFTLLVCLSLYLHHNPHGLCLDGEFRSNLTNLQRALDEELYGQHLAKKIITAALRTYVKQPSKKALVLSFHGGTGVGKNFVSNLIAKHLFKWGHKSLFVHKIIIPLHFPHKSEVEDHDKQLNSWITGNVSQCNKRSLFIFDEMDKIDVRLMDTLRPFLNNRGEKSVDFKGAIFLFLSNSGGNSINHFVWENHLQGKAREDISLPELEQILHQDADQNRDLWYREILKSGLVDHVVPFLPLERTHVKQCIRRDLREKGHLVSEDMIAKIADEMTYFPANFEVFSASGCKKVSSRVDVGVN